MKKISVSKIMSCFLLMAVVMFPSFSFAEDGICASVKIEIRQEMTLERQAFDAHMRINNGLDGIFLENVNIEIFFTDENGNSVLASSNPDDTAAKFFIGKPSMTNIDNVNGTGKVLPSSSVDINWLIIPATGASNGLQSGTLYYVGATLTYTINGQENITQVSPDYIYVKPMPELTLDYFLPEDVYGDDAVTSEIEPIIPFTLGVRVSNNGSGMAKNLKIDSAQPKIVDNEQGLLIGFNIDGCEVNGNTATPSLLADFGDIQPKTSGIARWIMTCSLSGKFVEFTADYSHSDELGGELTSLLKAADTHILIHDVWVDSTGKDNIRDFLAKYGDGYKVYESENIDNDVSELSASSNLTGSGVSYTLSTSASSGFIYVKLTDPKAGTKILKEVVRSDGKIIKPENAWLSKTRDKSKAWQYFFNLFDTDNAGSYTVVFEDASAEPKPPNIQFIPDRTKNEGEQLGFIVEATDPNRTIPILSSSPLPVGAKFTDKGNGTAAFDWTPSIGQAGIYPITFTASDGELKTSRSAVITINGSDSDKDGMADYWEIKYFGNLSKDGKGDSDGDGISDLYEYKENLIPVAYDHDNTLPPRQVIDFGAYGIYIFDGTQWMHIDRALKEMKGWGNNLIVNFGSAGLYLFDGISWTRMFRSPEDIEVWKDKLVLDYGSQGLYLFDGTSWTWVAGSPEGMKGWKDKLVLDYGSQGLYLFDGTSWTLIAGSPEGIEGWGDKLVGDFGDHGIYLYDGNSWNGIAGNPENIVGWGDKLVGDFGDYGVYLYDGISWNWIAGNSENIVVCGNKLVGDFGNYGTYQYDGTVWQWIAGNPDKMASWGDKLAAYFNSYGLYVYDGNSWTWIGEAIDDLKIWGDKLVAEYKSSGLHFFEDSSWTWFTIPTEGIEIWNNKLVADYGNYGLYIYDGASWTWIAGDPQSIVVWKDKLVGNFVPHGIYLYDGSSWTWVGGSAEKIAVWGDRLAGDFDSYGVYLYDGKSWTSVGPDMENIDWEKNFAEDSGSFSLFYYNGRSWTWLAGDSTTAQGLSFGSSRDPGFYLYDGVSLNQISTNSY